MREKRTLWRMISSGDASGSTPDLRKAREAAGCTGSPPPSREEEAVGGSSPGDIACDMPAATGCTFAFEPLVRASMPLSLSLPHIAWHAFTTAPFPGLSSCVFSHVAERPPRRPTISAVLPGRISCSRGKSRK